MTASDIWDRISLVQGDITTQRVGAIVNAANSTLLGGGGVDGAIHRAAGPQLLEACRKLGGCPTGSAKITPGFDLPAGFVIHAVGPRYRDGRHGEADHLASCYTTAVQLAAANECDSIAFPAISCGIYAYPLEEAARVSLQAVANALPGKSKPQKAMWVLFDDRTFAVFQTALDELRNPSPPRSRAL